MDCVYCILQAYLNQPYISCFTNLEKMITELDAGLAKRPQEFFRIGTGEFTDSLALDKFTGLSRILVNYMADKKRAILELKTKSAVIDNLADLNHNGRTVISWSLNSLPMMQSEELYTASLEERLAAAKQCAEWGYKLAFHFDPIIEHSGWEAGYQATISRLFNTVPADAIVWISLGALRYLPSLKPIATDRFAGSRIFYQEFITGLDGKSRYFISQRAKLYQAIYAWLKAKADANTCIYFCMESEELWQQIMGFTPQEKGGLRKMLDRTVYI
jgi:spore photoproduct lyase